MVGIQALGRQLAALGLLPPADGGRLEAGSPLAVIFMEMFTHVGDALALQYGGSGTNKRVGEKEEGREEGGGSATGLNKHRELLTTIRRYYSNAFTDQAKQDAMNLFLGHFIPAQHDTALWELENDYFLHNTHVKEEAARVLDGKEEEDEDETAATTTAAATASTEESGGEGKDERREGGREGGREEGEEEARSLYEILGVDRTASPDTIKKAYYR
ncbi:hypothetical protein VYU27_010525, partial [Nannochloropsis oceanica]